SGHLGDGAKLALLKRQPRQERIKAGALKVKALLERSSIVGAQETKAVMIELEQGEPYGISRRDFAVMLRVVNAYKKAYDIDIQDYLISTGEGGFYPW